MLLGQKTGYPERYSPELLETFARRDQRAAFGADPLPAFYGVDLWNAWELTWLTESGKPAVAAAQITVPADSPRLIESKSLKLYLNSHAMTAYAGTDAIRATIARDLSEAAGAPVDVALRTPAEVLAAGLSDLPGTCIDDCPVACDAGEVDPGLLRADPGREARETLHSHLFRSNCPVTGQPDHGSIAVAYRGPAIDPAALLRYLVSYRRHNAFHESCIERIFRDLKDRCAASELAVCGYFARRGGIDINPLRSDGALRPRDLRVWRQ